MLSRNCVVLPCITICRLYDIALTLQYLSHIYLDIFHKLPLVSIPRVTAHKAPRYGVGFRPGFSIVDNSQALKGNEERVSGERGQTCVQQHAITPDHILAGVLTLAKRELEKLASKELASGDEFQSQAIFNDSRKTEIPDLDAFVSRTAVRNLTVPRSANSCRSFNCQA